MTTDTLRTVIRSLQVADSAVRAGDVVRGVDAVRALRPAAEAIAAESDIGVAATHE